MKRYTPTFADHSGDATTMVAEPPPASEADALRAGIAAADAREERRFQRKHPHWKPKEARRRESAGEPKPQVKVEVVTLTENEAMDGYELRFPGKGVMPTLDYMAEVARMKLAGWKYAGMNHGWKTFDPRWYHRRTPAAKEFADEIVKRCNPPTP